MRSNTRDGQHAWTCVVATSALVTSTLVACAAEPALELEETADEVAHAKLPRAFPGPNVPIEICSSSSGAFTTNITNPYFPLEVCSRRVLAGIEDGVEVAVRITVLDEIAIVDGIGTRVVEEYHTEDGELVEVSYNYFAQAKHGGTARHGTVCYFGENVDIYEEDGSITHEGQWVAGADGALPGIIMPGHVEKGQAYLQEVAPGIAEDRAWHVRLAHERLVVFEDSPLEPGALSRKVYRKGIGLVRDDVATLVSYEILDDCDCQRAEVEAEPD